MANHCNGELRQINPRPTHSWVTANYSDLHRPWLTIRFKVCELCGKVKDHPGGNIDG